jgi:hypothetical protein
MAKILVGTNGGGKDVKKHTRETGALCFASMKLTANSFGS